MLKPLSMATLLERNYACKDHVWGEAPVLNGVNHDFDSGLPDSLLGSTQDMYT